MEKRKYFSYSLHSFLFVRLGIMSRGPDTVFQGAASGPRAVVCYHCSNGSWGSPDKLHCSSSKAPLVIDRLLLHHCSNGSWGSPDKLHCSSSKAPLVIDRLQLNLSLYSEYTCRSRCELSGKSLQWKSRYSGEGILLFK